MLGEKGGKEGGKTGFSQTEGVASTLSLLEEFSVCQHSGCSACWEQGLNPLWWTQSNSSWSVSQLSPPGNLLQTLDFYKLTHPCCRH